MSEEQRITVLNSGHSRALIKESSDKKVEIKQKNRKLFFSNSKGAGFNY